MVVHQVRDVLLERYLLCTLHRTLIISKEKKITQPPMLPTARLTQHTGRCRWGCAQDEHVDIGSVDVFNSDWGDRFGFNNFNLEFIHSQSCLRGKEFAWLCSVTLATVRACSHTRCHWHRTTFSSTLSHNWVNVYFLYNCLLTLCFLESLPHNRIRGNENIKIHPMPSYGDKKFTCE